KPKENIYVLNMVIGVILASIAFTSFPENYSIQKLLALVFGLSGASAIFVKSKMKKAMIPKVMLSVSIIASFILLLI
ncbi:MAG: hypothetical protein L0I79_04235, partial [Atopostipes sp.]|nr:hypothetical protein [Atopostipes sp.]